MKWFLIFLLCCTNYDKPLVFSYESSINNSQYQKDYYVIDPSPELINVAIEASNIWMEKTKLDIRMGRFGIPIYFLDQIYVDGSQVCGETMALQLENGDWAGVDEIHIAQHPKNIECYGYIEVMIHELGHMLSRNKRNDPIHVENKTSIMYKDVVDTKDIDKPSHDLICRNAPCKL